MAARLPLPTESHSVIPIRLPTLGDGAGIPNLSMIPVLPSAPGGPTGLPTLAAFGLEQSQPSTGVKLPLPVDGMPIFPTGAPGVPSLGAPTATEGKKETMLVTVKRGRLAISRMPEPVAIRPPIDNSWTVERVAKEAPPIGWEPVFKAASAELKQISDLLEKDNADVGYHFVPNCNDLFKAFDLCPLAGVRLVIIGQDPYHTIQDNGKPIAEGLSFSVPYGVKVPPSLTNIYKEIKTCYPDFNVPHHGSLHQWAAQGVLMLNVCLTTRPGMANAHGKFMLWMPFMMHVFAAISKVNPTCVYVMWGKEAQKIDRYIGEKSRRLTAAHPSPFSAHNGFFGCKHFRHINTMLGTPAIDWQL